MGKSELTVRVVPYRQGLHTGNIIWSLTYPMKGGRFPTNHPCADAPEPMIVGPHKVHGVEVVPEPKRTNTSGLDDFRRRGYWASCFPEGDGITFIPLQGQSDEQQAHDVREAFGWEVPPDDR